MTGMTPRRRLALLGLILALTATGCQRYRPETLPAKDALADTEIDGALTVDAVVRLALERDPALRVARAQQGVARAILIQSGILPNPTLNAGLLPLVSGMGTAAAWNFGLGQDVKALATYRSRRRAGRDEADRIAADLLWREWQVAGEARQLAVGLIFVRQQQASAAEDCRRLAAIDADTAAALADRDIGLAAVAPAASAYADSLAIRDQLERDELQLRHRLAALLARRPDAPLTLDPTIDLPRLDPAVLRAGVTGLPLRRPDLLALRLGHDAQEEAVRQAILLQFPDLVLGASATRDSSAVVNFGPTATFSIPVFDRGRGGIAAAEATRARLAVEYSARLDAAAGEVEAQISELEQRRLQLAAITAELPEARQAIVRAEKARVAGVIDATPYIEVITVGMKREQAALTLARDIAERQIALQTLLGLGLPEVKRAVTASP